MLDIINKLKENNINILSLRTEFVDESNVKIFIVVEKFERGVLKSILVELKNDMQLIDLNTKVSCS